MNNLDGLEERVMVVPMGNKRSLSKSNHEGERRKQMRQMPQSLSDL